MKGKRKNGKRNLFMSVTIMCLFLTVTFKFDGSNIYWFWENQIQVPVILGLISIISGIFWILENRKLRN